MPIPILLLTGFLGSGKTTFINWLLNHSDTENLGIILNEFGAIKLESQFIQKHGLPTAELQSGCMCCVAKGDVPRAINLLLDQNPNLSHLVIEASGLSDPEPIKAVLQEDMAARVKLDMTLGLVDAQNFFDTLTSNPIIMSQLAEVDLVVISKSQLVDSDQLSKLQTHLENILFNTPSLVFSDQLVPSLFLDPAITPKLAQAHAHHDHQHQHYQEWWFSSTKPLQAEPTFQFLSKLDSNITRAKGVVFLQDQSGDIKKYLYSAVCGRGQFTPIQKSSEQPTTNILFLGNKFDTNSLQTSLQNSLI